MADDQRVLLGLLAEGVELVRSTEDSMAWAGRSFDWAARVEQATVSPDACSCGCGEVSVYPVGLTRAEIGALRSVLAKAETALRCLIWR